jgi:hypothetical protein
VDVRDVFPTGRQAAMETNFVRVSRATNATNQGAPRDPAATRAPHDVLTKPGGPAARTRTSAMANPYRGGTPGRDMTYMDCLVQKHNMTTALSCTHELILAICWEEGLFNNGSQIGGSAIGFGQTEPGELQRVKKKGAISVDVDAVRRGDDDEGMEAICQLMDYYISTFGGLRSKALRGYAGYDYKQFDPKKFPTTDDWHKNRQGIIDGWEKCEAALMAIPAYELDPAATMAALAKSRSFTPSAKSGDGRTYQKVLFPNQY